MLRLLFVQRQLPFLKFFLGLRHEKNVNLKKRFLQTNNCFHFHKNPNKICLKIPVKFVLKIPVHSIPYVDDKGILELRKIHQIFHVHGIFPFVQKMYRIN